MNDVLCIVEWIEDHVKKWELYLHKMKVTEGRKDRELV